jgi:hypothetical protein
MKDFGFDSKERLIFFSLSQHPDRLPRLFSLPFNGYWRLFTWI